MDSKHVRKSDISRKRKRNTQGFSKFKTRVRDSKFAPSSTARRALSLARRLNNAMEVKAYDIVNSTTIGTAGIVLNINDISQGDGQGNRDGNSAYIFKLNIRWVMSIAAADNETVFRVIVFSDRKQVGSVVPTVLSVLSTAEPKAQFNVGNRLRWKIYQDFWAPLDLVGHANVLGHMTSSMKLKVNYSGATGATWDTNGLFMLVISDENVNKPTFSYTTRCFFNDN